MCFPASRGPQCQGADEGNYRPSAAREEEKRQTAEEEEERERKCGPLTLVLVIRRYSRVTFRRAARDWTRQ